MQSDISFQNLRQKLQHTADASFLVSELKVFYVCFSCRKTNKITPYNIAQFECCIFKHAKKKKNEKICRTH